MTDASSDQLSPLSEQLSETRERLANLLDEYQDNPEAPAVAGLAKIAEGLDDLLLQLEQTPPEDEQGHLRLNVLLQGLRAVADFLSPSADLPAEPVARPSRDSSTSIEEGLKQFISAFQKEAQKRLSGLSISMMGLFTQQTSDQALDKSAQHLHAIRGGAAMLNLTEIASVSGSMEQILVTMRKLPAEERVWPTKALMRGYRLIETAVASPDVYVDPDEVDQVRDELQESFDVLLSHTTLEELSRPSAEVASEPNEHDPSSHEAAPQHTGDEPPRDFERSAPFHHEADEHEDEDEPTEIAVVFEEIDRPEDEGIEISRPRTPSGPFGALPDDVTPVDIQHAETLYHPDLDVSEIVGEAMRHGAGYAEGMNEEIGVERVVHVERAASTDALDQVLAQGSRGFDDTPTATDVRTLEQTISLHGMEQRILIVDDVETIAASIGFVVSELDLPIDIAADGIEALKMLRERPYSLVISDIAMPRMDGVTLTRTIREDDQLSDIPLILLTGLDQPSERTAGIGAGANDFIIKGSIGGGELVHRVRELLKIAPFVPTELLRARNRKRILVAEDVETIAASIAFILSEGNYDITLASNGHEALTRLERSVYDLLISDWQMPSMSGYELTQAVRASSHITPLPIILLTSMDSDKVRRDGLEAGADRFLVKGEIAGGALLEIVEELLTAAS